MFSEDPYVSALGPGFLRRFDFEVVLLDVVDAFLRAELIKTEGVHVDVENSGELLVHDLEVPLRKLGGPVVGEGVCPSLLVCEVVQVYDRYFLQSELRGGLQAAVALDDGVLRAPDADRIVKSELLDAFFDGFDVFFLVPAGVVLRWFQLAYAQIFVIHGVPFKSKKPRT